MGKFEQMRGTAVRAGLVALVALPLLGASTSALAAGPEWVAVNEMDGVTVFALRDGGREVQPDTLAARVIVAEPTPVQIYDDGNGLLSFELPKSLVPAAAGPIAPKPAFLYDNSEGVTYFAP